MKVFLTGATGVLGRRVVRGLVQAGHTVIGAARSEANRELLEALGAEARACDVCDPAAVTAASQGCEKILHLATAIPEDGRRRSAWDANDRLRIQGTQAVAAAARRHEAALIVQSITFLYGDRGGDAADETTPIASDLFFKGADILHSAVALEKITAAAARDGVPAAILRCGSFYAHDAAHTRGIVALARGHKLRVAAGRPWIQAPVHVDDAAAAFVLAVNHPDATRAGEPELWNVVDDEPAPIADIFDFVAAKVGAPRPTRVPAFLARVFLGGRVYRTISASARVSNTKIKERLGWRPRYPSFREGYAQVLSAITG